MDLDDFIASTSNSQVLTTDEALNIILQMRGSQPRAPLVFSSVTRMGAWKEYLMEDLQFSHQQIGYKINVPFTAQNNSKGVDIKSVFFVNNGGCVVSNILIGDTEARMSQVKNRFHMNSQLYEAVFENPVLLPPVQRNWNVTFVLAGAQIGTRVQLIHKRRGGKNPPHSHFAQGILNARAAQQMLGRQPAGTNLSRVQQMPNYQAPEVTFSLQNNNWYFVVGFKYKVATENSFQNSVLAGEENQMFNEFN